jgi:hypothetical protein
MVRKICAGFASAGRARPRIPTRYLRPCSHWPRHTAQLLRHTAQSLQERIQSKGREARPFRHTLNLLRHTMRPPRSSGRSLPPPRHKLPDMNLSPVPTTDLQMEANARHSADCSTASPPQKAPTSGALPKRFGCGLAALGSIRDCQRSPWDARQAGPIECAGRAQRRRRFHCGLPLSVRAKAASRFACPVR